ncbi:hypothetical protein [Streptacidiphilus monticola]|uniref:Uncharacterized protein n=1 Tax=Streptacidiphilus monticola TaxID=2161674 RepID=A0ABW1G9B3_9ACTN
MSTWIQPTPAGLSSAKAFRFHLDAQALADAEGMSLLRVDRGDLMLAVGRLRSALDDALRMVGELAATQVHPHAETTVGTWRWSA